MKPVLIKNLNEITLKNLKCLYLVSFDDSKIFVDFFFERYAKNAMVWYEENDSKTAIKIMSYLIKKRLNLDGKKVEAFLIYGVAVNKKYQKQNLMTIFFNKWLLELKKISDYIFIQAYDWNVYRKFCFSPTVFKSEWFLKKDQFLKDCVLLNGLNFELMNQIYLAFLKFFKIKNYVYKTNKEFKAYYKMFLNAGDKILQTKKAWIVLSNNKIIDFAFADLKEFIKLVSLLPFETKISSVVDLDKRYFTPTHKKEITTKMFKKNQEENLKLYFNDFF